ncbi:DUF3313 family protein [Thermaurantiacus sp.]
MAGMRLLAAAVALALAVPAFAGEAVESWDGLVEVRSRRLDAAFLMPGADFRPYKRVMLDPPGVAFRRGWMQDMQRSRTARLTEADAARIREAVAANITDIFVEEFTRAGFEVVTVAGPDVLRVRTDVVNLFINAPDVPTAGRSRSFTTNAGEATLVLEARDSDTGALLARAVDRQEARGLPGPTTRVSNSSEFRTVARGWARIAASRLQALQAISPLPETLTPGQRLD